MMFSTVLVYGQYRDNEYSYLGVSGGVSLFDINTSDLATKQGTSFVGTLSNRGAFYNAFDLVWEIGFVQSKIDILANSASGNGEEYVGYNMQSGQVKLLGSYNIILERLSLEFGPVLNLNGKLNLDEDDQKNLVIAGYNNMTAEDIRDITNVNFRLQAGITGGIRHVRLSAQYQYGVTNMLNNLNDDGLEVDNLKGNSSTILLMAVVYF
ncbi:hypothetical protein [Aureitalea marina]|nr:hypothetical protein [Aureitalea marina]